MLYHNIVNTGYKKVISTIEVCPYVSYSQRGRSVLN